MPRLIWFAASLALTLGAFSPTASAQTKPAGSGGERRTVVVSVLTEKGQLVSGLQKENFRATLGGQDVQIISAQYDTSPHRVLLLLDVSGSMYPNRPVESLFAARLLDNTAPGNPVAVLTFSGSIVAQVPFSTDRTAARTEIANLKSMPEPVEHAPLRKNPILDALDRALGVLSPAQPGDSICLISDGLENVSNIRADQAKQNFGPAGVRIFDILFLTQLARGGSVMTIEEFDGTQTLADLARMNGGDTMPVSPKVVHQLFTDWSSRVSPQVISARETFVSSADVFARQMSACYRLEIELPAPMDKPRGWKLEVLDPSTGKPDHKLVLHYPSKLYPLKSSDK